MHISHIPSKDGEKLSAITIPQPLVFEQIVIGVDPGTAITGYGVVGRTVHNDFVLLACGVIRTPADHPMHLRLLELYNDFQRIITEFAPDEVAVEKLFFGRNVTTAISVGQATRRDPLSRCTK